MITWIAIKEFLLNPKVLGTLGIGLILFLAYNHYQGLKSDIKDLQSQVKVEQLKAANLQQQLDICQDVNNQNKQMMSKLDDFGVQAQHHFDSLSDSLESMQQKSDKQVQSILNTAKPKTCQGAIDYLVDAAKRRSTR